MLKWIPHSIYLIKWEFNGSHDAIELKMGLRQDVGLESWLGSNMLLLFCWEWSLMVPIPIPLLVSLVSLDIDLRKKLGFFPHILSQVDMDVI